MQSPGSLEIFFGVIFNDSREQVQEKLNATEDWQSLQSTLCITCTTLEVMFPFISSGFAPSLLQSLRFTHPSTVCWYHYQQQKEFLLQRNHRLF